MTPRKDGPRTEAARGRLRRWVLNETGSSDNGAWSDELDVRIADLENAIEAEAAAVPRDQHGWSAEDYERLAAAGPRDRICVHGTDVSEECPECGFGFTEAPAGPRDDGLRTAASILLRTVDTVMPKQSPYGCPHSRDWLNGLLDDLRAALSATTGTAESEEHDEPTPVASIASFSPPRTT